MALPQKPMRPPWSRKRRFAVGCLALLLAVALLGVGLRIRVVLGEQACLAAAASADIRLDGPQVDNSTIVVSVGKVLGVTTPDGWYVDDSTNQEVLAPTIDCQYTSRARAFLARAPGEASVQVGPGCNQFAGAGCKFAKIRVVVN
jgi:hypothetical protein